MEPTPAGKEDTVHRVTLETALRARAAAYGARRLLQPAMRETLNEAVLTPSLRQALDDLDVCTAATMRVAASLAAGCLDRGDLLPVAISTLARMNVRLWEPQTEVSIARRLALVDHVETSLATLGLLCEEESEHSIREPSVSSTASAKRSPVDNAVGAALEATNRSARTALHVLLAVALRALNETV